MNQFPLIAKTLFGLEPVLAQELKELGATNIEELVRAVKFDADLKLLYEANLHLRTALSILKPIEQFLIRNEKELYEKVKKIEWENYFDVDQTFAIDATVSGEIFTHSKYVALKTKDAIADRFREKFDRRPNVHVTNPDLRINVRISFNECSISIDSSGEKLNRRGYRRNQNEAPINEVLAAGIILLSGWDKKRDFLDPMCGSGTFPIEAALMATNTPPGHFRGFAFQRWKDYDPELWKEVKREAKRYITEPEGKIEARDISILNIRIAKQNAENAGMDEYISFEAKDLLQSEGAEKNSVIILNPPYGERLNEGNMSKLYEEIGSRFKHFYPGNDVWIISSNMTALKSFGLRPSKKKVLFNGSLECKLHFYELYSGSKKNG